MLDLERLPLDTRGAKGARPGSVRVDEDIVDYDNAAQLSALDRKSTWHTMYVGLGYRHDGNPEKGGQTARFVPDIPKGGRYAVFLAYPWNPNRATNVPVTIHHADGETKVTVNEKQKPAVNELLQPLGTFRFE